MSHQSLSISTVFARFRNWTAWRKTTILAQSKAQLHFVHNKNILHSSHRCGHRTCLIHCVFEDRRTNESRERCQEEAIKLREYGEEVPQYCTDHDPPCLMQLQALTTMELLIEKLGRNSIWTSTEGKTSIPSWINSWKNAWHLRVHWRF